MVKRRVSVRLVGSLAVHPAVRDQQTHYTSRVWAVTNYDGWRLLRTVSPFLGPLACLTVQFSFSEYR